MFARTIQLHAGRVLRTDDTDRIGISMVEFERVLKQNLKDSGFDVVTETTGGMVATDTITGVVKVITFHPCSR